MRNSGIIVMIDRPVDEIKSDIRIDRRPLLAEKGVDELDNLSAQRMDTYRACADVILDNSNGYANGLRALERTIRLRFGD